MRYTLVGLGFAAISLMYIFGGVLSVFYLYLLCGAVGWFPVAFWSFFVGRWTIKQMVDYVIFRSLRISDACQIIPACNVVLGAVFVLAVLVSVGGFINMFFGYKRDNGRAVSGHC